MVKKRVTAAFRPLEQSAAQPVPAAARSGIPGEVIAAISGAVAMLCGKDARIVGIKPGKRDRAGRSAWSMAGLLDNTRAF